MNQLNANYYLHYSAGYVAKYNLEMKNWIYKFCSVQLFKTVPASLFTPLQVKNDLHEKTCTPFKIPLLAFIILGPF